jgi:hypothetical protein
MNGRGTGDECDDGRRVTSKRRETAAAQYSLTGSHSLTHSLTHYILHSTFTHTHSLTQYIHSHTHSFTHHWWSRKVLDRELGWEAGGTGAEGTGAGAGSGE